MAQHELSCGALQALLSKEHSTGDDGDVCCAQSSTLSTPNPRDHQPSMLGCLKGCVNPQGGMHHKKCPNNPEFKRETNREDATVSPATSLAFDGRAHNTQSNGQDPLAATPPLSPFSDKFVPAPPPPLSQPRMRRERGRRPAVGMCFEILVDKQSANANESERARAREREREKREREERERTPP